MMVSDDRFCCQPSIFIIKRLIPDKKKNLMALWWARGMGRRKQTSVCFSKLAQCVSKVYLSSRTRWQRPARIKEVGLRPTLTFSTLSTWNESAPSSDVVCDIGWAHDAGWGWGCNVESCPLVSVFFAFFFSFAFCFSQAGFGSTSHINSSTWALRKWHGGCSWSRTSLPFWPRILHSMKFLWNS